jgi:hypothetical protein
MSGGCLSVCRCRPHRPAPAWGARRPRPARRRQAARTACAVSYRCRCYSGAGAAPPRRRQLGGAPGCAQRSAARRLPRTHSRTPAMAATRAHSGFQSELTHIHCSAAAGGLQIGRAPGGPLFGRAELRPWAGCSDGAPPLTNGLRRHLTALAAARCASCCSTRAPSASVPGVWRCWRRSAVSVGLQVRPEAQATRPSCKACPPDPTPRDGPSHAGLLSTGSSPREATCYRHTERERAGPQHRALGAAA